MDSELSRLCSPCSATVRAYNRDMTTHSTKVWELSSERGALELSLPDMSSLDALTRQLPQGYYSTFRTYDSGKRVLGLRAHLQRLYQPTALQQTNPAVPVAMLRRILAETLKAHHGDARVRLMMSLDGRVFMALEPLKIIPSEVYARGVKVITSEVERQSPRLKSTAFISASEGLRAQIAGSGTFEALLVRNGFILEGMTSNFFYIKDGVLGTARRDILLGVTRRTVLRVARGSGLSIVYRSMKQEQVPALTEAFLTSSSRGIVPIVQINNMTVGKGIPGPITKELMDGYTSYVMRHTEKINPR
jgi:branched-chain amino acid aminotransferase